MIYPARNRAEPKSVDRIVAVDVRRHGCRESAGAGNNRVDDVSGVQTAVNVVAFDTDHHVFPLRIVAEESAPSQSFAEAEPSGCHG